MDDAIRLAFDENFAQELRDEAPAHVMSLADYDQAANLATASPFATEADAAGAGMRLAELVDALGVDDGLAYAIDKDGDI